MANYIEKTNINAKRFVPVSSRYANNNVVYYTEQKKLTFELYKKNKRANSKKDKFYVISSGTEYRPDLVSQKVYGTVDFWWRILEANNIKDIFDFKAGMNIRIPDAVFG